METILEQGRKKFDRIAGESSLMHDSIKVVAGPLSPSQAIGTPSRQDFPLLTGKEVIVEAEFRGSFGQAFTSEPRIFEGCLQDVLNLPLQDAGNRAILLATLNAVTGYLGMADRVRHCRDEEPEKCAAEMAKDLLQRFGKIKIGIIGYQPAILENLAEVFKPECIRCTDLNPANVGTCKFGIDMWNGATDTSKLIDWCDLVLVTSSTFANDTFDNIYNQAVRQNKRVINFGITGAGLSALLDLERLCFYGH